LQIFNSDCLERIPAIYANMEERPFQGRVTNQSRRASALVVVLGA